jgi:hypothetical protein
MMLSIFKRNLLFTIFFIVFSNAIRECYAQTYDSPQRIEFEVEQDKFPYNLRLMEKNGLILISKNDAKDAGKWTITHYDTNFTQLLTKDIKLEIPLFLSAINSDKENFYAILQSSAEKTNIANTYIVNYNVLSKKIDVFSFYMADKARINSITLFGDVFVFTTAFESKSEERIYLFNSKLLITNRLYEHKTSPCEFQQAYLDTIGNSLWLITKFYESKKQTTIVLTKLNSEGKIIQEKNIIVDENYYLNSCKITRLDADQCVLIGEFAYNSKENMFTTKNNNAGIFSISLINNEIQTVFYLEYGILEGPFLANKKNSPDLHSNTYIAAQTDSIFIVITDFYKPEYVHDVYPDRSMGHGVWGAPTYLSSEAKLVGFRYHLSYFFIYDKLGKMQWYNTFNYNGMLLKNRRKIMRTYIENETQNTLYYFAFDGKLYSLINNKDEIIQPISIEKIDASSRFFSVSANITYNCEHWYNNYFVYYGYQLLYNRYASNKSKRSKYVFYVNKLGYK